MQTTARWHKVGPSEVAGLALPPRAYLGDIDICTTRFQRYLLFRPEVTFDDAKRLVDDICGST